MTVNTSSVAVSETQYLEINGHSLRYREQGTGQPLILLHRFRASIDDWDPAFISALAAGRRVIAFDSLGIGGSQGEVPATLEGAADIAARFTRALGLERAAFLGWSMGGMTAQILAIKHPDLVSALVLAGTLPPGGSPEVVPSGPKWSQVAGKPTYEDDDVLYLFFTGSDASRAAGRASLARMTSLGRQGSAVKTSSAVMQAQLGAIIEFYQNKGGWYERLKEIGAPTFVANGDRDGAFPAIDSVVLAREIPGAHLAIYPDAGHGFLFQDPERFGADVLRFLEHPTRA